MDVCYIPKYIPKSCAQFLLLIPRDGTQGQASYYEPSISKDKDHPLACGDYGLSDDELLVALPKAVFTQDLCHKTIWAQVNDPRSSQNGKRVDNIKIVDLCPEPNAEGQGCGPTKVDLSDGAAKAVYGDDYTQPGVFNIEWGIA
ncbi:MAG: hypothetical protein M1820_008221 [Bogoriella megaspora]|nr:MAG: hypothetical protein M1820_008221 [Bogoriella megaspora]